MILNIQKHIKKISLILMIILTTLTVIVTPVVSAREEGRCEEAYENCVDDAVGFFFLTGLFLNYMIYCTAGYVFCKKYLEK